MTATWIGSGAMAPWLAADAEGGHQAVEHVVDPGPRRRGLPAHRRGPLAVVAPHGKADVVLVRDVEDRPREPGRQHADHRALPAPSGAVALGVLDAVDVERQSPDEIEAIGVVMDADLEARVADLQRLGADVAGDHVLGE